MKVIVFSNLLFFTLNIILFTSAIMAQDHKQTLKENPEDIENISLALDGYDVLTYYLPNGPIKGLKNYQAVYQQKRYLFATPENQKKFSTNPEKYLPKYEEYCLCALSERKLVKADPKVFKIVDDNLLLFEDIPALKKWNENEPERFKDAQIFLSDVKKYESENDNKLDTKVRLFTF